MSRVKKKKSSNIFSNILIIILIGIIIFSGYNLGKIFYRYHVGTQKYEKMQELAGVDKSIFDIDWAAIRAKYKGVKAWIYQKGTKINYPVAQGDDNKYYLTHLLNGDWDIKGTIFIDYRCKDPFHQFNTILYGHHMKDGTMFEPLVKYRDDEEYYRKHPMLYISTPEQNYEVQVFSAMTIPARSKLYKFDYPDPKTRREYLHTLIKENEIPDKAYMKKVLKGKPLSQKDRIVMLSTCTYEFNDARLTIFGRLVKSE